MFNYLLRRIALFIPLLWAIATLSFFMMRLAPGGPFDQERALPPEVEKNIAAKYHLDEPLIKQYGRFLGGLLRFDFGPSYKYPNRTVNELISGSFPVSLQLGIMALLYALAIGIPTGVISSVKQNTRIDYGLMTLAMVGISVPNIVLGPMLQLGFGMKLGWLPVAGWDSWRHSILPAITLGSIYAAYISRLSRGGMLEVVRQDFIRTARAKGVKEASVVGRHAMGLGMTPVISLLGPAFAGLITGSVVVEKIFQVPGLGQHFVQGALNRDYTLVMGTILFYSIILIALNLMVDMLYALIDPRVRYD